MSLITNINFSDENNCSFILNNIDKSLVNALRRTIMSDIPTYKFRTEPHEKNDVKIIKNTCALHNEFILQRIGMLPVFIEDKQDFDPSQYIFKLSIKNNTNNIMDVTTQHFKVYFLDNQKGEIEVESEKFFKPDPITNEYILITKLKPDQYGLDSGEEIMLEAKLSSGTGKENAGYSPVSKVVFYNSLDENKIKAELEKIITEEEAKNKLTGKERERLIKRFQNFEAYRHFSTNQKGEPNKFNFEIESIGTFKAEELFNIGIDIIKKDINYFNLSLLNEDEKIELSESPTVMDGIDILIKDQGHTLGNLLQSYLFNNYVESSEPKLDFVGYKNPHPLTEEIVLRIKLNEDIEDFEQKKKKIKDIINENTQHINHILDNMKKEWNQKLPSPYEEHDFPTISGESSDKVIIKKKKSSSKSKS